MSKKNRKPKIDHGIATGKVASPGNYEVAEEDMSWMNMVPIKRYKHFTLFWRPAPNGKGWYECFLNRDVDKHRRVM